MTEQIVAPEQAPISEDQVVSYLRANPDFFTANEYLLSELKISHKSGSAISLGARQVQVFREHRDELKQKLNTLISIAHENDAHFEKSKRLLLNLLEIKSLDEIDIVVNEAFRNDPHIDFSSILVFGAQTDYPVTEINVLSLQSAKGQLGSLLDSAQAICGAFETEKMRCLFPSNNEAIGSAAIIPIRDGELLGVFCLGSRDPAYFDSGMGSLFLSYISDFMSRILPNLLLNARSQKITDDVPSLLE
ncbi:MAG: hypothetical protein ACI9T9_000968 [Oleiphilaceae bacterium]|jgi:uncharacterized protein YigA (DUF484 family)